MVKFGKRKIKGLRKKRLSFERVVNFYDKSIWKYKRGCKKQERICSFYVSDYHFEMITLPYIENEIKQNHNVVILTENDLNETIKKF